MVDLVATSYVLLAALELTVAAAPALLPYHLHMLLAAVLTVHIGAHLSCAQEVAEKVEKSEALTFPVVAGGALAALFVAFKYLPNHLVNALLNAYFCAVGVVCVGGFLLPLVRRALPSRALVVDVTLPLLGPQRLTAADVASYAVGAAAAAWYAATKVAPAPLPAAWLANNVLGVAFAVQGIERVALGEFVTGALLLAGLFVYDVVMVFGTPLMVDVATKLDGPIKLLFPRGGGGVDPETGKTLASLLGLGDIAIPGIYLALLLRFDALRAVRAGAYYVAHATSRARVRAPGGPGGGSGDDFTVDPFDCITADFSKPYFNAALLAYAGALALTVYVMVAFDAAQPALLYIVPAVLLATAAVATARGEWSALFAYRDDAYVSAVISAGAPPAEAAAAAEPAAAGAPAAVPAAGDPEPPGAGDGDAGDGAADAGAADAGAADGSAAAGVARRRARRRD